MAVLVYLVLLLVLTGHSSATYCVCKDGVGDTVMQKNIDYACGAGADCSAILQNGACYNPNTVKDHCSYAVNSYYQKKGQAVGSCDFSGTAVTAASLTSTVPSGCVYQANPSTLATPSTTTPSTGTVTGTGNGTGTGTGTTPSTTTSPSILTPPSSVYNNGLGPSSITDNSQGASLPRTSLFSAPIIALWFSGLFLLWG